MQPETGDVLSGILHERDFLYHLLLSFSVPKRGKFFEKFCSPMSDDRAATWPAVYSSPPCMTPGLIRGPGVNLTIDSLTLDKIRSL